MAMTTLTGEMQRKGGSTYINFNWLWGAFVLSIRFCIDTPSNKGGTVSQFAADDKHWPECCRIELRG